MAGLLVSVQQTEDGVPDASDVRGHEPLGAADVAALEGADESEVLAHQTLDAARSQDGHGPDGAELAADLVEQGGELGVARLLDEEAVEVLAQGPDLGVAGRGGAALELTEARLEAGQRLAIDPRGGQPHDERLHGLPDLVELPDVVVGRGPDEG